MNADNVNKDDDRSGGPYGYVNMFQYWALHPPEEDEEDSDFGEMENKECSDDEEVGDEDSEEDDDVDNDDDRPGGPYGYLNMFQYWALHPPEEDEEGSNFGEIENKECTEEDDVEDEDRDKEENETEQENLHERAWSKTSRLYWESLTETEITVHRFPRYGVLRAPLIQFRAAVENLRFNMEMWREESLNRVLTEAKLAFWKRLFRDCDVAFDQLLTALTTINMDYIDLVQERRNLCIRLARNYHTSRLILLNIFKLD